MDYLGRSTAPERPRLTVEEYLDRACGVLGVDEDELASRRREPRIRELRELVAVLGVEKYGQRVREIAGRLEKNLGQRQPLDHRRRSADRERLRNHAAAGEAG